MLYLVNWRHDMINKIKKLLGHKFENRYTWGELYTGFKCRDLSFRYTGGGIYGCDMLIVSIPFLFKSYIHTNKEKENEWDSKEWSYGFYVYSWTEDVVFEWEHNRHRFEFPWMLQWQKTEILDFDHNVLSIRTKKDKNIYTNGGKYDQEEKIKESIEKQYAYTYILKSGEIQNCIATIKCVDRMTWGWKWFPWKRFVRTSIDVRFSEEVGEKSGSWKGGCTECGYNMLPNETAEQCLRRMERERKFN